MIIRNKYTTVAGSVTLKSATDVTEVARKVPLERLLLKTTNPTCDQRTLTSSTEPCLGQQNPSMGIWAAARIAEKNQIRQCLYFSLEDCN